MAFSCTSLCRGQVAEPSGPNIIVIVSDDAGYADFSFHGSGEVKTPHLKAMAERGVRFRQGYVTASVCSPSRAGLLTGRYQQRFGHEKNIPPKFSEVNGLPLEETTIARVLQGLGYVTIGLGKWHLGYADHFHPLSRGFDHFYGFLQGARSYWPIKGNRLNRLLRDRTPLAEEFDYLTDELGREAAGYIEQFAQRRFFLYLSFNAVHTPMHVPEEGLNLLPEQSNFKRRKLLAMTEAMDRAIGLVLQELQDCKIEEETLVFFVNDNGGATNNASKNGPLRGTKGTPFEGGIRIPFLAQWPGTLPSGMVYDNPVSTLDIFATALGVQADRVELMYPLDGVDLLPFLLAERVSAERPHNTLCWRRKRNWAVRQGDWKLVYYEKQGLMLFDLRVDTGEQVDLKNEHPEQVKFLKESYAAWEKKMTSAKW